MSHLTNPLATVEQLYKLQNNGLPEELRDSILYHTARLTQAAGILLRLPQSITAQANVLLFRYWLEDDLMEHEFSDISAATMYMTAKISASPRSLRSITNVYAYLLSEASTLNDTTTEAPPDSESYYLSEASYIVFRNRLLNIEGQLLNALGFNTHVALPHSLAITYLQTLDVFTPAYNRKNKDTGYKVGQRAIAYLNTALLSPQMLYLTHQPCALATAAIYLAAKDRGVKLPDVEWWEVFDCEREELGFLAVALTSVEGLAARELASGRRKGMITRGDIDRELEKLGKSLRPNGDGVEDEEAEMARMLDAKVGAA